MSDSPEISLDDLLRAQFDHWRIPDPQLRAGIAAIVIAGKPLFRRVEAVADVPVATLRARYPQALMHLTDDDIGARKADEPAFFELLYGAGPVAQALGNTQQGDGYKFRGRGITMARGRMLYSQLGTIMGGIDLAADPDLLFEPKNQIAAATSMAMQLYRGGGWQGLRSRMNGTGAVMFEADQLANAYLASGEFGRGVPVPDPVHVQFAQRVEQLEKMVKSLTTQLATLIASAHTQGQQTPGGGDPKP